MKCPQGRSCLEKNKKRGLFQVGYSFKEDLEKAKVAEGKFIEWCKGRNVKYDDVRLEKSFQDLDVDIVIYKDDKPINIEIKSDDGIAKYNNNIAIELISNIEYKTEGWWKKTSREGGSKWLLFYSPQRDLFYKIKTQDIKQYIAERGFLRQQEMWKSWCGLINLYSFCRWKGIELDSLIFMQQNKKEVA